MEATKKQIEETQKSIKESWAFLKEKLGKHFESKGQTIDEAAEFLTRLHIVDSAINSITVEQEGGKDAE